MSTNINKKKQKYVTLAVFEQNMASVARSFASTEEHLKAIDVRLGIFSESMTGMMAEMRMEAREDRQSLSALAYNDIHHERSIDDLQGRVRKLEQKSA